jgi:hypothetical protein
MDLHRGSCHCGTVRFQIAGPLDELTTCDCSLCVKRNALMVKVPEGALEIIEGDHALTLYQWNTRRAKHYFCSRCGIYVFHRKRAAPEFFGVNVFCLDGLDRRSIPVRATEGANMTVLEEGGNFNWPGPRVAG